MKSKKMEFLMEEQLLELLLFYFFVFIDLFIYFFFFLNAPFP